MGDLQIDYNFVFTERAGKAMRATGQRPVSFGGHTSAPTPQVGDLFSVADLGPIVFRIAQRELHWASPDHLVVTLVLDEPGDFIPTKGGDAA